MLGSKIWNSLTSSFQIDIQGSRDEFQRGEEYDGPLLWDFIRRRINPSTTVGASKMKDEMETKKLSDFGDDVIKFNTWFEDTRERITKEEGDGYNEYLRSLFRSYLTSSNKEFVEAINAERRNWIQGKLKDDYSYQHLMELARVTFNNLVEDESWSHTDQPAEKDGEKQYLALATLVEKLTQEKLSQKTGRTGRGGGKPRTYAAWRFSNPENESTKTINGRTMKWCTNDCHDRPMWCGRPNCLNREDFAAAGKMRKTAKEGQEGVSKVSEDFKIALAALTTEDDFAALADQFFPVKE